MSHLIYRYWRGPTVGLVVTQIWQGYGARIFISFGSLEPADYSLRDGSPGAPHGAFELTNMDSLSDWVLTQRGRIVSHSDWQRLVREKALTKKLLGRRLLSVQINQHSRSTRLTFTAGLVLTTTTMSNCSERYPHWLLRVSRDIFRAVILKGTSSPGRRKSD